MLTFHELIQGITSSRPNRATKQDCCQGKKRKGRGGGEEKRYKGKKGGGVRGGENTQKSPKPGLSAILSTINLFLHPTNMCGYLYPGIKNKNTVSGLIEFILY